jgi:aldehyde:ferredoxin oxidoreductase
MGTQSGKLLDVDLSSGTVSERILDDQVLRDYVGGSGLAAKLFVDDAVPVDCDPLGPENNLYIITGALTGSGFPATPRFAAAAKSPLTGIWGESNCGGFFGPALKSAGWDGIVVRGQSEKPVTLFIDDGKAELQDASNLWGKDTYETVDALEEQFGDKPQVRVISVGQAGENLVKFANIADGRHDYLGRTGLGAVMGSKKLKAVAARGTGKVTPANRDTFAEMRTMCAKGLKTDMLSLGFNMGGTNAGMTFSHDKGDVPIKNWTIGEDHDLINNLSSDVMNEKYLTRPSACFRCPIACKRNVKVEEGPYKMEGAGPEYETMASFGTMCTINDQAAMNKINDLCNRYGLDTISCGCTMAFAIDCYEAGILTDGDTDGLKLNWGNADAIIEVIKKIAAREGFGDTLAEGSKEAAKRIGKGAADLTSEVKGLEVPMHDPRTYHGLGLAYAMSIRGACHLSHFMLFYDEGYFWSEEFGIEEGAVGQSNEGKGGLLPILENFGQFMQTLGWCYFAMNAFGAENFEAKMIRLLNAATGRDYTLGEMKRIGERIWLLKRALNNMMGVTVEDDRLPRKNLTPVNEGDAAGLVPDIEMMMKEYYDARGLDLRGFPSKGSLIAAGLADIADKLNL